MKNKFITIIIAFITVFFSQSQVWASSENLKIHTEFNNIQIDKSVFLSNDDSPAIIARRVGDVKEQSSWWIASVFIVGLGQIMMGDFWRGFKFTLITSLLTIIQTILLFNTDNLAGFVGGSSSNITPWIFIFALIISIFAVITYLYILNISDAYNMSKEQSEMSKLNDEQIAKLEKELKTVIDFANSVNVSDSGAISVRALAF